MKKSDTIIEIQDENMLQNEAIFEAFKVHPTFASMMGLTLKHSDSNNKDALSGEELIKEITQSLFVFYSLPQAQVRLAFSSGINISMIRFFKKKQIEGLDPNTLSAIATQKMSKEMFSYEIGLNLKQSNGFHVQRFETFDEMLGYVRKLFVLNAPLEKLLGQLSKANSKTQLDMELYKDIEGSWIADQVLDTVLNRLDMPNWSVKRFFSIEHLLHQLSGIQSEEIQTERWEKKLIQKVIEKSKGSDDLCDIFFDFAKESAYLSAYKCALKELASSVSVFSGNEKMSSQANRLSALLEAKIEGEHLEQQMQTIEKAPMEQSKIKKMGL